MLGVFLWEEKNRCSDPRSNLSSFKLKLERLGLVSQIQMVSDSEIGVVAPSPTLDELENNGWATLVGHVMSCSPQQLLWSN